MHPPIRVDNMPSKVNDITDCLQDEPELEAQPQNRYPPELSAEGYLMTEAYEIPKIPVL